MQMKIVKNLILYFTIFVREQIHTNCCTMLCVYLVVYIICIKFCLLPAFLHLQYHHMQHNVKTITIQIFYSEAKYAGRISANGSSNEFLGLKWSPSLDLQLPSQE